MGAGFLGWTLDAFDFFVVIFLLDTLAEHFRVPKRDLVLSITATLAMRPVGALVFGMMADRYGRRRPLMVNVLFFATIEFLCGFAPNFTVFFILRMLFGIGMGGEWGVGASLTMEHAPVRWRGVLSGILQSGYSIGYLLAALAARFVLPNWGWRAMFWVGGIPALLALYIRTKVPESEAWKQHHPSSLAGLGRTLASNWKLFLYFTLFMMAMHMSSHGTQDMYPTFLEKDWGIAGKQRAMLTAISMGGAILGGLSIGWISDRIGRRRAMLAALGGALLVIPLWAFAHTLPMLVLGAVLIQFCVQGAWGVVPAHVAELSPDSVRGTLPGLGNQIGVFIAGGLPALEAYTAKNHTYAVAMAGWAAVVFCLAAVMTLAGQERKAAHFGDLKD